MVEVFKTNVRDDGRAKVLIKLIRDAFSNLEVNFDLEDCDKVLRIESRVGIFEPLTIVEFLKGAGVDAEVLPDTVPLQTQENY